jgi:hypothetical protein
MQFEKRLFSATGLTFPFRLAAWQSGVGVQRTAPLNSPSDKAVGNNHVQGMNNRKSLTSSLYSLISGATFEASTGVFVSKLTYCRFLKSPLLGN